MSDFNVSISGATTINDIRAGDRLLTNEWKGVKKLLVYASQPFVINNYKIPAGIFIIEFPQIGSSLPCVFEITYVASDGDKGYSAAVVEYGGQADPDYFNIIGVDERGNPTYTPPN